MAHLTYNAEQYIDLIRQARRLFQARNTKEALLAYNVAQQFYIGLTPQQREEACNRLRTLDTQNPDR